MKRYCNDPGFLSAEIDCFCGTVNSALDLGLEGRGFETCSLLFHYIGVGSDRTLHPRQCVCVAGERVPVRRRATS